MNARCSQTCSSFVGDNLLQYLWFGGDAMKNQARSPAEAGLEKSPLPSLSSFLSAESCSMLIRPGGVLITGSPIEGQALTASNNIVDADGLGPISYQWKSASNPIPDATSPTYVLQDSDVGTVISVVATYTDLLGTEEVVSSQPTGVIESSSPLARQSSTVSYSPDYTSINGRTFGYYVPESYDPSTPTPLLFMFHGMGGNSSEQSGGSAENSYYGWQTSAHENGFIVLFPESLGYFKTWDLGGGGSSSDLSFVDDMIGWASTNYNISTSQIFTTGHSWGAYFSYYVATFRSDDIAAFGAHSGGLGGAFF